MTSLADFNRLAVADADALIRPCLDVDRWVDAMLNRRPYATVDDLLAAAGAAADPLTAVELEAAMSHHPRIGESPTGSSPEAGLSRSEQAGLTLDDDIQSRLAAGNRNYEKRFDRVFLIRAAGRSATEILSQLESRLGNDLDTEDRIVGEQLHQIAALRLAKAVTP